MSRQNTKLFLLNIYHIVLWLCTEIQQAQIIRCIYQLHKGWIDDIFLKFLSTVPFFSSNLPQACNAVHNYWTSDSPKCKYYNRFMYSLRLRIKKNKRKKVCPPLQKKTGPKTIEKSTQQQILPS